MITTPSWLTIPEFCTSGTKTQPIAGRMTNGYLYLDQPPAEEHNWLFNGTTKNSNTTVTALTGVITEIQNSVTANGNALAPADNYQLIKTIIANGMPVGTLIQSEVEQTPAIWTSGSAVYNPVIARWDADHDVTSTQAPDLVTKYRAQVAKVNVAGASTTSWTGTVAGSVITFASNPANLALLNMVNEEGIANGYIATQTAGAAALFTGTAQRCINVNGTDYPIANCSVGGLTITVTGSPTTGSQTCIVYPYRIAGSTTSIRLPRLSGFVGVTAYDYDGVIVSGFRKMDRFQGHFVSVTTNWVSAAMNHFNNNSIATGDGVSNAATQNVGTPASNGVDGTARTGKTTDPRTYGVYTYTFAGRLLA